MQFLLDGHEYNSLEPKYVSDDLRLLVEDLRKRLLGATKYECHVEAKTYGHCDRCPCAHQKTKAKICNLSGKDFSQ